MVILAHKRSNHINTHGSEGDASRLRANLDIAMQTALKFAFRVHQFAGGFDEEATRLFTELHDAVCGE
jgi:hypothetical protein